MTIKEAQEIIEMYHWWEDRSCNCPMGHPPCAKCTEMPDEDTYKEAERVVNFWASGGYS